MTPEAASKAQVYLGLGSNIDAEKHLGMAIRELRRRYGGLEISAVYENAAVGFSGANFLNLVVGFMSDSSALEICNEIELIHNLAGRTRSSPGNNDKWVSRPLDIDLLLYNDRIIDERPVHVPRSDILDYAFVLRPLAELAPGLVHPVSGKTIDEHWQQFDASSHPLELVGVVL